MKKKYQVLCPLKKKKGFIAKTAQAMTIRATYITGGLKDLISTWFLGRVDQKSFW